MEGKEVGVFPFRFQGLGILPRHWTDWELHPGGPISFGIRVYVGYLLFIIERFSLEDALVAF